jgi:uncharacterized membrane protein
VSVPAGANFCPLCRQPISGDGAGLAPAAEPADRLAAAAAYFTFLPAIVFLLVPRFRTLPLIRFHAWQSLLFHGVWLAVAVVLTFVAFRVLTGMPSLLLWPLYALASFLTWCVLVLKAWQEEFFQLPILGEVASKQAEA